jgi:isoleucyl-tRNA synthetase
MDEKGRKMSKSIGNVVSPQDVIKQNGADVLRLWVAMIDYRDDMSIGNEIMTRISEGYRKIRNTARFLLANLSDFDPATQSVSHAEMRDIDRWILSRTAAAIARCRQAYEEYEFHTVYHRMLDLCTVDLSSVYLDIIKDTMYVEAPNALARRSAQTAMYAILKAMVGAIAPILPFTAEEVYELIPGERQRSVHLTEFPVLESVSSEADQSAWDRIFALREAVSKVLERARAERQIGQALEADIVLTGDFTPETLLGTVNADLAKVFIVSHVYLRPADPTVADFVELPEIGRVGIAMTKASGQKCARCWNYREEVMDEIEICARCEAIVHSLGPDPGFTEYGTPTV